MKLSTQILIIFCMAVFLPLILIWMVAEEVLSIRGFCLIILLYFLIAFFWVLETVIRPLRELQRGTEKIMNGDLDFTLESDSSSELGELVRSFEEMRLRLRESKSQQLATDNETRELVRNIAHDLKTPLTTIKGYSEGLLDGIADSPEKQEKYLKTIHNKAEEMSALIDELSYYSRVDSNRIPYAFGKIPAVSFFDGFAEEAKLDLEGKDIRFLYRNAVKPDVKMIADPEQIKKVLNNIIGNSVKYMDTLPGTIEMTVSDRGDFVQCDITDSGKGVDKKDLSRIYDRFYRTDASRGSGQGGSGIGLSIAKKIIEDHGGSIWASCEEGSGLTQHFILRKIV